MGQPAADAPMIHYVIGTQNLKLLLIYSCNGYVFIFLFTIDPRVLYENFYSIPVIGLESPDNNNENKKFAHKFDNDAAGEKS